jgi:hypothetical protein
MRADQQDVVIRAQNGSEKLDDERRREIGDESEEGDEAGEFVRE